MKPFRIYLIIVLLVAGVVTGGRSAWEQTLKLGCLPAGGIKPADSWLDNCASDRIGDYAHGALWFDLEPAVKTAILNAKVLIFGDSRMLAAMSHFSPGGSANATAGEASDSATKWFEGLRIPFYLLAFTYGEQSGWAERLFAKLHPHPAVMIFDTDPYFTGGLSLPAQAIETDPAGERLTALQTKSFLEKDAAYCNYLRFLCGRTTSGYRSIADGHLFEQPPERFWFGRRKPGDFPITPPLASDPSRFGEYLEHARKLIADAQVDPSCVVFTVVPNSDIDDSLAKFLAQQLGAKVIAPHIDGLATADHWHLTLGSAQTWTAAFLADLKPVLNACIASNASDARFNANG